VADRATKLQRPQNLQDRLTLGLTGKSPLTIVVCHNVRDLRRPGSPRSRCLSVERFCRKIDYIQTRYGRAHHKQRIGGSLVINQKDLPPNTILLTFIDSYSDQLWHPVLLVPAGPAIANQIGRQSQHSSPILIHQNHYDPIDEHAVFAPTRN
jgi:hypothetical protein